MPDVLDLFHPEISAWFRERYGTPTAGQRLLWPLVSAERHALLAAPTGTGKTLAAFLWAIDRLVTGEWGADRVRVLYVSPLKALNNDVRRNLLEPLAELRTRFEAKGLRFPAIEVATRSGDTPQSERRRMVSHPPSILITTPESLNLMVTATRSRGVLTDLATVILDEIHAVAASKRGTHLMLGVERLVELSGEFQRIALSATVRPTKTIARFVGGARWTAGPTDGTRRLVERRVEIVETDEEKRIALSVRYIPREHDGDERPVWERIAAVLREEIASRGSSLVFVNSRRLAEQITHLINDAGHTVAFAHHGSLSKELRLAVEERLKEGRLGAIVATSSLELGIDIGDLDAVYLVESPFSVSSTVQRIGRSGHVVGRSSTGVLYASHGRDILDAAVLARLVETKDIEPIHPVAAPLDVLSQVLLAMIGVEPREVDELYDFIRTVAPYRRLSRGSFDSVVEMLAGRYEELRIRELKPRIHFDRETGVVKAGAGVLTSVYAAGGTIPDRGYYRLTHADSNVQIGELDEEFVWERKIGDTFALGTQLWRITAIDHQRVSVVPHTGGVSIPPFWRAEGINRSYHLASRVGAFLKDADEAIESGPRDQVPEAWGLDAGSGAELYRLLAGQRAHTGVSLPHRRHVVVEETTLPGTGFLQVFVHTLWGNRVNFPCTVAVETVLSDDGWDVRSQSENDCMHFVFPTVQAGGEESPGAVVRNVIGRLADTGVIDLLRRRLEGTGLFGTRFRENAGRALLLPRRGFNRRMPLWLTRMRSKRLAARVSSQGNFPITAETWRECLEDELELPVLESLLEEIASGAVAVSVVRTSHPSPFTENVVWRSTNQLVYIDDTPERPDGSSVDDDVVRAALRGPDRPLFDRAVFEQTARKIDRTAPGYAPDPGEELVSWTEERVVLSAEEWNALLAAVRRDHLPEGPVPTQDTERRYLRIEGPDGFSGVCTVDAAARLLEAAGEAAARVCEIGFGTGRRPPAAETCGEPVEERIEAARERIRRSGHSPAPEELIGQWLTSRPPVPESEVAAVFDRFGFKTDEAIALLLENGSVSRGPFFDDDGVHTVCDTENVERALRTERRVRRRGFDPVSPNLLPLFFATWHGLAGRDRDLRSVITMLEGLPLEVTDWEHHVFPSRCASYSVGALDALISTSDLTWVGCGTREVCFALEPDVELYLDDARPTEEERALLERLFPDDRGTYDFYTLHERSGLDTAELTGRMWDLAWRGLVGTDTYEIVRRGALSRFTPRRAVEPQAVPGSAGSLSRRSRASLRGRRRSFAEWSATRPVAGRWFRRHERPERDPVELEEIRRERARVVVDRYGVVFGDLLRRELPGLSWRELFRTMRLMELAGEIVGGYFVEGVPGLQFASREALDLLSDGLDGEAVYWVNAADPASVCGLAGPELRPGHPERLSSTYVVYEGTEPVLVARRNGEALEFLSERRRPEYLGFYRHLTERSFDPVNKIKLDTIDGKPAVEDHRLEPLLDFGFRRSYRSLSYWRGPR